MDFFTDEVLPLHRLLPRLLAHRRGVRVDSQMVLITSLCIPGICDGSQANTSTFARTKAMSASSYFSSRFPTMRVVLVESAPICTVFTGTSSGSDD